MWYAALRRLPSLRGSSPRLHGIVHFRPLSSAAAAPSVDFTVASFKDLKSPLRMFFLRVHPDVIHRYSKDAKEKNEKSLSSLSSMMEQVEHRYEGKAKLIDLQKNPLPSQLLLPFYYKPQKDKDNHKQELEFFEYVVKPPVSLEYKERLMMQRGTTVAKNAEWLQFACNTLQGLLHNVEIPAHITVDASVAAAAAGSGLGGAPFRESKWRRSGFPMEEDPEELFLKHLLENNPLEVGKETSSRRVDFEQRSVFSVRERKHRVLLWLQSDRVQYTGITRAEFRQGLETLYAALVRYYDQVLMYEKLWDGVRLFLSDKNSTYSGSRAYTLDFRCDELQMARYLSRKMLQLKEKELQVAQAKAKKARPKYSAAAKEEGIDEVFRQAGIKVKKRHRGGHLAFEEGDGPARTPAQKTRRT